ncbi:M48 family metalloprotease [Halocatena marina]|uniref:M48 family metalloprotease n=1 Tax=Halocatena marina TaxID=2934937 RepID=A0ABD5YP75_9EURY|nr:M48 family metalloprotease [Halocatena marina]
MNWSRDWELGVRMAVTLGLLAVVTCVLIGALFGGLTVTARELGSGVFPSTAIEEIGIGATVVVLSIIVYTAFSGDPLVLRGCNAQSVTSAENSAVQQTVERLSQQADLPVPSVVVADTPVPNSYTSGLSSQQATIVVTTGLLEKLDPEELRTVLAHELAHVKHRDAAVMTVASVPLVIARTLYKWVDDRWDWRYGNDYDLLVIPCALCLVVSGAFWLVGRLLFRLLSRYRELAADRGAIALTGSPAALASALETISTQHESLPREDLRSADGSIEAFAVVPVETETVDKPLQLGPNGDQFRTYDRHIYLFQQKIAPFLTTHPSIERRREQLQDIETEI